MNREVAQPLLHPFLASGWAWAARVSKQRPTKASGLVSADWGASARFFWNFWVWPGEWIYVRRSEYV